MKRTDLAKDFRASAMVLRSAGWEAGAAIWELAATQLEEFDRDFADEKLTLKQASEESLYSEFHLRRLLDDHVIPNSGEPGAPRIKRRDLPRLPRPIKKGPRLPDTSDESEGTTVSKILDKAAGKKSP